MAAEVAASARHAASALRVESEALGGSALSTAIQRRSTPAHWVVTAPASPSAWAARVRDVQEAFAGRQWTEAIAPALSAEGAGRARLERVVEAGGVVVTTGQQPGLFGGPIYTWSKALSALALADAIERDLGVAAAPLFWAATDDADLAEAQSVWVALESGPLQLHGVAAARTGTPVATIPQGDLREQIAALRAACGSAAAAPHLELAAAAYGDPAATVGRAFIQLLEGVLGPLGICVLDASNAAVARAGSPVIRNALERARDVAAVLTARAAELRSQGFEPQVDDVPGLTPVFVYEEGAKRRARVEEAARLLTSGTHTFGANVLLRPVMERAIVPTVAYVAGPGELAYFAQVTALAGALGVPAPLAVPRWSGTIVEPRMQRVLARLGVNRDALADRHAVEGMLARAAMPGELTEALASLRAAVSAGVDRLAAAASDAVLPSGAIDGLRRRLSHQLDRIERRAGAGVKRRESALMRDVAAVRGYFYPGGTRQERALTLIPSLARHGPALLEAMLEEARAHASRLMGRT